MVAFWVLAGLMTAVALAFVLVPLLGRRKAAVGVGPKEANLDVLRAQRREIETDVANGTLPAEARDEALAELVARAEQDLAGDAVVAEPAARRPVAAAIAASLLVPALAFGVYLALGTPHATDPQALARPESPHSDPQIVAMVETLAQKVRERPDDARGWALLARSMSALGRFKESADAYAHLATLKPDDPQVLADYADALGMTQGRSLAGKPYELVKKALAIDPRHTKSLALAGTAAMDTGDFPAAMGYWQTLRSVLPADSPDAAQVASIVEEVRERAKAAGKPLAAAAPVASGAPPSTSTAAASSSAAKPVASAPSTIASAAPAPVAGKTVSGLVTLAPEIAKKVQGSETIFVFARADGGARLPLAVLRASATQLPLNFSLDDSSSMSPDLKLSAASAVRIEARISRSGNATPQPGDLVGTSAVVKPGARDVKVVVDREVPAS
jgi:cytochrome c-type biogenesis protein CcmH